MKNNELLRSILEQFLSIFDQSNRLDSTGHVLVINEAGYPEKFHPVIRRLNKVLQSPQIEDNMNMEDEVVGEFNKQSEMIEEKQARYQLIKNLANTGMSITQIATIAEISEAEVVRILRKEKD